MANSLSTTYVLCTTQKAADVATISVQQSDYEHAWDVGTAPVGEPSTSLVSRGRAALQGTFLADVATLGYRTWFAKTGLTKYTPDLKRVKIESLI